MEKKPILQPGDLDKVRWAVEESADISTNGIIKKSRVPWNRGRAALDALLEQAILPNVTVTIMAIQIYVSVVKAA